MCKNYKKIIAGILAASMVLPAGVWGNTMKVEAQQVSGTAPYINTWLVSGPYDIAVADEIYGSQAAIPENAAKTAQITASTALPANPPSQMADGTTKKQWVSQENDKEPWVNFAWEEPITINQVKIAQWGDGRHRNQWYHITFTCKDGSTVESGKVESTSDSPQEPTEYLAAPAVYNVVGMKIEIDKDRTPYPGITGLSEVEIYYNPEMEQQLVADGFFTWDSVSGADASGEEGIYREGIVYREGTLAVGQVSSGDASGNDAGNSGSGGGFVYVPPVLKKTAEKAEITPALGSSFGLEEGQTHVWEYFDDRLYNRTYDDYQDLMGYFSVKKGMDTRNKYLYAHTYVYSPVEQQVNFNIGATGSYRVYVNDSCVSGAPTVPEADPQKDMVKLPVTLKEGWNKILIQLYHAFTEDLNGNGIPAGADAEGAYAGFYGRIADASGNTVEGLEYSVTGQAQELQIVTQGLSSADAPENGLPDNDMPTGYKEWPYVWNKSVQENQYGVASSAFRFMAGGGVPGYTWKIVEGSLPEGLELKEDGVIADGLENGRLDLSSAKGIISMNCEAGDYPFTVEVTDKDGNTARKGFTITVKDRPNKWFEDGKVSALTHVTPIYNLLLDPNYDVDGWAQRAKLQGHSMVSVESIQQAYFWPSKFADPRSTRHSYFPQDENGNILDSLKPFEEAVKRYGMRFGVYYGPAVEPYTTDSYVQNLSDLVLRYDPDYIYLDGPQSMGRRSQNFDIIYSAVRNLNNDILINANAWGAEYGDVDLRTEEAAGMYAGGWSEFTAKRTIMEPWKMIRTKNAQSPYYGMRDDYREVVKEMLMNSGRGYADNNDQTILDNRGPDRGDSVSDMANRYCIAVQEFIDVRELAADWFAPEGSTERHEAMTGTTPYYLSGWGYEDDGRGNYNSFALAKNGLGPDWGYAVYRDNNIYLNIMKGPDKKKGLGADSLAEGKMTIAPVKDTVTKVTWLNEEEALSYVQEGESLTIDLAGVAEDQIATIIKVQTDNPDRSYKLTNLYLTGDQIADDKLQLQAEGYMTFPALKAALEKVAFSADSMPAGVQMDANGLITASADANGTMEVTVTGTYEGVSVSDSVKVTAQKGMVYLGEELTGVTLKVEDRETYGKFDSQDALGYEITGRSVKGGSVGLNAADIKWHGGYAYANDAPDQKSHPVKIEETDTFLFSGNSILLPKAEKTTRAVVWAEVSLDGHTYTSNKVFMDIMPYENLSGNAAVTASGQIEGFDVQNAVDGSLIQGAEFDQSKWSVSGEGESWMAFDLGAVMPVRNVQIHFNSDAQKYSNTPKKMELQVSEDGKTWTTLQTAVPPSTSQRAYFGFPDEYTINTETQYVRLLFPEGGNSSVIDILEVKMNGTDEINRLADIDAAAVLENNTTAHYLITGYNGLGEELNLDNAVIRIRSMQPETIEVLEDNKISAVKEGRAELVITVTLDNSIIEKHVYANVDSKGRLYFGQYLSDIRVVLNKKSIAPGQPVTAQIEAFYNDGSQADMSQADVAFELESDNLAVVEGSSVITMKENISRSVTSNVKVRVTLDGITLESKGLLLTELGSNIAGGADVTVSSVRDRNGDYDGNNQDSRYLGTKAVDGDKGTHWAAKRSDVSAWIEMDFGEELLIGSVNLVDRGHQVNEIGEGKLEFFDEEGDLIHSQMVEGIKWNGQPDNTVVLEQPIEARKVKFTIDPEGKYYHGGNGENPERGLAEMEVMLAAVSGEAKPEAFKTVYASTTVGSMPSLPGRVTAVMSDGATQEMTVVWEAIPEDKLAEEGIFNVYGTVEGTDVRAFAQIKVTGNKETRKLLQETYDYAKTLDTSGVVDSAVKQFEAAMKRAEEVLENDRAKDAEVIQAWDDLLEGIWGLGLTQGDKSTLKILIDKAQAMLSDEDKYVPGEWSKLTDALKDAKEVMEDGDAMEEDVRPAAEELLKAILAQRFKARKDILQDIINKANEVDQSLYTEGSVQVMCRALAWANEVMADENLSEEDQPVVDKAAKDLNQAVLNLVKKEDTDPTKPEDPTDPSENPAPSDPEDEDSSSEGKDGQGTDASINGSETGQDADIISPKTGDSAPAGILILIMVVGTLCVAGSVVIKKKKH